MRWGFSPQQCQSTQHFMGSVPRGALRSPAFFFFFFWFWIMIHLSAATATSSPAATAPVEHGERHKDLRGVRPSKCHRGRCSARIMCLWTFLSAAMLPVMYCAALLSFSWGPGAVFRQEMCISKRKKKERVDFKLWGHFSKAWPLICEISAIEEAAFFFSTVCFSIHLKPLKATEMGMRDTAMFPASKLSHLFLVMIGPPSLFIQRGL